MHHTHQFRERLGRGVSSTRCHINPLLDRNPSARTLTVVRQSSDANGVPAQPHLFRLMTQFCVFFSTRSLSHFIQWDAKQICKFMFVEGLLGVDHSRFFAFYWKFFVFKKIGKQKEILFVNMYERLVISIIVLCLLFSVPA